MITVVDQEVAEVRIPQGVVDLASFRRWASRKDFPDEGRVCFLQGNIWIDMSKEDLFSHNQVKAEYNSVLYQLARKDGSGLHFPDSVRFTNVDAVISNRPDGLFVSWESLRSGFAELVKDKRGKGYVELLGRADMVMEIVSRSSVRKHKVVLRQAYWQAGILEYWLVDARQQPPRFDILRHTARGYAAVRKQDGWLKSAVFGKSFRLGRRENAVGLPEFTLAVR
jgi:Uma2 family endonuclease